VYTRTHILKPATDENGNYTYEDDATITPYANGTYTFADGTTTPTFNTTWKDTNGVVYYAEIFGDTILNTPYTVTLEGAGYRTVKYTVNMTEAKTLNFWNNVKDNEAVVENDKEASAVTKNFLAGDIVGDNQINIYDLSAVVSYFATSTSADYAKYTKYDLNRDGVIDSKDVAYVLVSWGE
jgi:hypothetical protein